jgi:microtubule-associated protein-like 6
MTLPSQLRNIKWNTYTCLFGWPVQGIWPPVEEVEDDKPEPTCVCRSDNEKLLAVGFSNGEIRIYNNPCVSYPSLYRVEKAHVGPVLKCCFDCNSTVLLSIGQKENGIVTLQLHLSSSREGSG